MTRRFARKNHPSPTSWRPWRPGGSLFLCESGRAVDNRREKLALRAEGAVDARFAAELPHVGTVVDDLYVEVEAIAWHDGVPELRFVDAEEVHEARLGIERIGDVGQD